MFFCYFPSDGKFRYFWWNLGYALICREEYLWLGRYYTESIFEFFDFCDTRWLGVLFVYMNFFDIKFGKMLIDMLKLGITKSLDTFRMIEYFISLMCLAYQILGIVVGRFSLIYDLEDKFFRQWKNILWWFRISIWCTYRFARYINLHQPDQCNRKVTQTT